MAKSTKIIAALGVAGMIVAPTFAASTDITSVKDTLSISIEETCSFKSEVLRTDEGHTTEYGKLFAASVANGNEVDFDSTTTGVQPAEHEFTVACNRNSGYVVKATATGLTGSVAGSIAYAKTSDYKTSGDDGTWNVNITKLADGDPVVLGDQITAADTETTIISTSPKTANAGDKFKATYKVYVGERTPAGTYTGHVTYTLAAPSA